MARAARKKIYEYQLAMASNVCATNGCHGCMTGCGTTTCKHLSKPLAEAPLPHGQEHRRGGSCMCLEGDNKCNLKAHREQQQPHEGLCHREALKVQLGKDLLAADLAAGRGGRHWAGPACAPPKVVHRQPVWGAHMARPRGTMAPVCRGKRTGWWGGNWYQGISWYQVAAAPPRLLQADSAGSPDEAPEKVADVFDCRDGAAAEIHGGTCQMSGFGTAAQPTHTAWLVHNGIADCGTAALTPAQHSRQCGIVDVKAAEEHQEYDDEWGNSHGYCHWQSCSGERLQQRA